MPVIDAARTTDWSSTGVIGGIPTNYTKYGSTLASSSTAAQINTAIAAAGDMQYVELGAGTFTLTATINIYRKNVILRGQGVSTILNWTAVGPTNFWWDSNFPPLIAVQDSNLGLDGYDFANTDGAPPYMGTHNRVNVAWNGTNGNSGVYTQGATLIDLASIPTGLVVGATLALWQYDPPDSSVPTTGYFVSAKNSNSGGTQTDIATHGSGQSNFAAQVQRVKVTAINGNQVTISPGLVHGNWTTARTPKAGWNYTITGVGLENFKAVANAGAGVSIFAIGFDVAADCWIKGVALVGGSQGGDYGFGLQDARNMTVRDSWVGPFSGGGHYTTTSYGISLIQCSSCLIENNILHSVEAPIVINSGSVGNVIAYNYEHYVSGEGGIQPHEEGNMYNLYEGNISTKFYVDDFHGVSHLSTLFRNLWNGGAVGVGLCSYNRWYNIVGNVVNGPTIYKSLYSDATVYDRFAGVGFRLGYARSDANGGANNDFNPPSVVQSDATLAPSTMIWGNYVTVVGSVTWNSAEVPVSDATFPNAVPPDHTLPNSLYLSGKPNWWGNTTHPWPAIGPDVSGGDITGYGGFAYKIPAQVMYETVGTVDNFDPSLYYATSAAPGYAGRMSFYPFF